jgi:nucleotide-binding universal stress UspA family protein
MSDGDGRGRIVVGVDGSAHAVKALDWAARQARLTGAELVVVGVWNWAATHGFVPAGFDWEQDVDAMLEESIQQVIGQDQRADVHKRVAQGHPAQVLLGMAEGADLLVVGSRGRGGFAGMLLGSTSQHVVSHADCPVVVVHATG